MTSFSFEYVESGEEEGVRQVNSYRDRQGPCGQVVVEGKRHAGSGCSPVGSVSLLETGETEYYFGLQIEKRKMMQFLEELESFKMVKGVYEVSFLLIDDMVGGSDVLELVVCLVSLVYS